MAKLNSIFTLFPIFFSETFAAPPAYSIENSSIILDNYIIHFIDKFILSLNRISLL